MLLKHKLPVFVIKNWKSTNKKNQSLFSSFWRSLIFKNNFNFFWSSQKKKSLQEVQKSLSQNVSIQIQCQQKNQYNIKSQQLSLQNIGWLVKKYQSKLQLYKELDQHKFYAFITIKPLIEMSKQQKERLIENRKQQIQFFEKEYENTRNKEMKKGAQEMKKELTANIYEQPVCQITIFVQKNEVSKYLCLQYLSNSLYCQLIEIKFYNRMIKNRIDRYRNTTEYGGRGIQRMSIESLELLTYHLESQLQLRKQVLNSMWKLALSYQQEEYLNWLKQIKEVV